MNISFGRDRLFNVLKANYMLIKPKKSYTKTTCSKHRLRKYPNLYNQKALTNSETCFVSYITYVKSHEETHYLSLVTDAYSRKIMGYQFK